MAWLNRENAPMAKGKRDDSSPEGLWEKCIQCSEIIFSKDFTANQRVCPKCQHHYPIAPMERICRFVDKDSFEELDAGLSSPDPLEFTDTKDYKSRLKGIQERLDVKDAIVCGRALLMKRPVQIGVFDFRFLGGSMGSVVGEKIKRLYLRAAERKEPAIIVSSSGGARMQEGVLSLMQMAKTCAALTKLRGEGVPFISILAHPTTGGVAASFAMLGDVNIGEPGALIGFAGPRVIQQTIGEELPEGFQRSEYLLEHGMLDMIVHRDSLRVRCAQLFDVLCAHLPTKQ
ncbi:acetyl-CoA carboxylase, carboxyltransferase subunit beta [Oligoflexaceae bacterium]|nr:acetyl-CoA carboxylase, carboxyltransferase subunit beta [Oligoflexaceae bacterium]